MYGGNSASNRAKWGMINSSGAERSHWGMVYKIQKNKEEHNQYQSTMHQSNVSSYHYSSRNNFAQGADGLCTHCNKGIDLHTPAKKLCPK